MSIRVGDWTTKSFRTTDGLQQCSRRPAQQERNKNHCQLSPSQPVIQSASRRMADRTGQGFRQGRTTAPPGQQHQGLGNRLVQPVDTDGHRSAALGPLRSTKTILGRTRGAERRDPSQPRRDVWGILDRMASPISLTLSHFGAHSDRTCPSRRNISGFESPKV